MQFLNPKKRRTIILKHRMPKTEKEIVFDIWGLKLFLGHVRHVKARRRVMKDLRKRQMFVLDY